MSTNCWTTRSSQLPVSFRLQPNPNLNAQISSLQWRESAEEMRHHGRQCAQNGSRGRRGRGGGVLEAGGSEENGNATEATPSGFGLSGRPKCHSARALSGTHALQSRSPSYSPPPRPRASYSVRLSRHYARGITVSNRRADPAASLCLVGEQHRPPLGPGRLPPPYRP